MKNTLLLSTILLSILSSCAQKETKKDYVTLTGTITNHNGEDAFVQSLDGKYKKHFYVNHLGGFSDTLNIKGFEGNLIFTDGNEMSRIYLKNGDEIELFLDTKEFDETITFKGKGAENNNYLAQKMLLTEQLLDFDELITLDSSSFEGELETIIEKHATFLKEFKGLDSSLILNEEADLEKLKLQIASQYTRAIKTKEAMDKLTGSKSPDFSNYTSITGEEMSLSDFKGKYIYMDIWATWCAPCKAEIPALKKLEEANHDKNIAFISVSVDDLKDEDKWKVMVQDKELKGVQLFADSSWNSSFMKALQVNSIPRFVLIDPNGVIIDPNAPRPSDKEEINELLSGLDL